MSDSAAQSPAKALPLFTLELGSNGGTLAPTNPAELVRWIEIESNYWGWVHQGNSRGGHENLQRDAMNSLFYALNVGLWGPPRVPGVTKLHPVC